MIFLLRVWFLLLEPEEVDLDAMFVSDLIEWVEYDVLELVYPLEPRLFLLEVVCEEKSLLKEDVFC